MTWSSRVKAHRRSNSRSGVNSSASSPPNRDSAFRASSEIAPRPPPRLTARSPVVLLCQVMGTAAIRNERNRPLSGSSLCRSSRSRRLTNSPWTRSGGLRIVPLAADEGVEGIPVVAAESSSAPRARGGWVARRRGSGPSRSSESQRRRAHSCKAAPVFSPCGRHALGHVPQSEGELLVDHAAGIVVEQALEFLDATRLMATRAAK